MSKLFGAITKDYARSLIITLVSAAIVIPLFCVLIIIPLWFANRPGTDSTTALWVMIVPAVCFLFIVIGGAWGTLFFTLRRRAKRYDEILTPLGLSGRTYILTGRQYHGTVQGRQVEAYFYRGPALDLRVSTSLRIRLSIANADMVSLSLARAFGRTPLSLGDPGLNGLTVFTRDEEWTRSLLANPEVQTLLRQLILNDSPFLMRQVHLEPGKLRLYLYRSRGLFKLSVTSEQIRQWLDALLSLARIAESLPW
jgi:hypothetical protein